jgi:hypothetical protein
MLKKLRHTLINIKQRTISFYLVLLDLHNIIINLNGRNIILLNKTINYIGYPNFKRNKTSYHFLLFIEGLLYPPDNYNNVFFLS